MSKQEDNRVAELEARIVQLESELASLRPSPKPVKKNDGEEGARIIQHGPAFIQPDDFPKQSELDSLLRIVLNAYPKLAADTHEYKYNFDRAFLSLCHIRRRSDIDKQNRMSYWRDHA